MIAPQTPIVLTYLLPPTMLQPHGSTSAKTNDLTSENVEMMMSIQEWTNEVQLCVTYEALNIAKYRFMCRAPFTIGDTTYLDDGIIEEQNLAAINGESSKPSGKMEKIAVGDAEINCSGHVLREIFSEEKARSSFDLNVKPAAEVGGKDVHMNGGEAGVGNEARNEPQCGGSVNQGASDNIINLLTDITMEDQTSTLHNTFVVDVGKSSTGSTADDETSRRAPMEHALRRQPAHEGVGPGTGHVNHKSEVHHTSF
ncbi:hypothetical protein DY000_02052799 [Brassica cretica]|uniref:Uncharacterized protein n=1 Tax=Brassica cretica TaxID=69181 RepID=A0ABQ7ACB8_BRACR|nr:hypothetical protein DY000_02052799 [Brassica cretica]